MNEIRNRRIEQGSIIPDDRTNDYLERMSRIFWDAERASDGFSRGWDSLREGMREVVRAGVAAVLAAIEEEQEEERLTEHIAEVISRAEHDYYYGDEHTGDRQEEESLFHYQARKVRDCPISPASVRRERAAHKTVIDERISGRIDEASKDDSL